MKIASVPCTALAAALVMLSVRAPAQHAGDIGVGRTAAGQLVPRPFVPGEPTPSFDVGTGVGVLTAIPDPPAPPTSFRSTDPGFDANFPADPVRDYYPLEAGASIRLVAVTDLEPAFRVRYSSQTIRVAGDFIALGSYQLHRHPIWIVDCAEPGYDPLRTLWFGTFILRDVGPTAYADSAPFTLRFSIVRCTPGDVNGDGAVDFDDIDPFVAALGGGAAVPVEQRCAADCSRDGYVTFDDIDPFVAALSGS